MPARSWHRALALAATLAGTVPAAARIAPPAAAQEAGPEFICGTWRVQGVVTTSPLASSPDDVAPFFGAEVRYGADGMRFGTTVEIARPVYRETTVSDQDFEDAFLVSFAALRIKGSSTHVFQVSDPADRRLLEPRIGTTVVVRNNDQILVPWAGQFMDLLRTRPCGG